MGSPIKGVIIKSTGSWYDVLLESGEIIESRIIGKFRLQGKRLTNPVGVGDRVEIEMEGLENKGLIKKIYPRENYVVRQSPHKKHQLHLLACNIDQACLIVTIRNPKLKQAFIDRFLLMTEPYNIPVIIVFNKLDLYTEDDLLTYGYLEAVYKSIGYKVLATSAINQTGIDDLRALLKNQTTLISGQSGVGKSSMINALHPTLDLRTKVLSDYTGKGQHTTTFAEMIIVDEQTRMIDTPGIKTLGFNNLEPMDVQHNFRELFFLSSNCKFSNCSHRNEPKCAVKDALEKGEISDLRYNSYLQIMEEIEGQNYWERHSDI